MRLSRTTGLIFLVGIAVLGLSVFQVLSIPTNQQKIKTLEDKLVVLRQKNESLSDILSEIKTIESNLEVVQKALPTTDEVPALIMQIEQIAKTSGLTIQHLGFGEGKGATTPKKSATGEVAKVSLTTVATGSYASLQTFLKNLENASRVVNVTNFRFSPSSEGEGEEARGLSITLGMEAFYLAGIESVTPETPLNLDTTSRDYIDLIRRVKALRVYRPEVLE